VVVTADKADVGSTSTPGGKGMVWWTEVERQGFGRRVYRRSYWFPRSLRRRRLTPLFEALVDSAVVAAAERVGQVGEPRG